MQITLRAARMYVPLSLKLACDSIGVSVDTVGNWERGNSFPDSWQIKRIEEVYHIRYDNLIFLPRKTL